MGNVSISLSPSTPFSPKAHPQQKTKTQPLAPGRKVGWWSKRLWNTKALLISGASCPSIKRASHTCANSWVTKQRQRERGRERLRHCERGERALIKSTALPSSLSCSLPTHATPAHPRPHPIQTAASGIQRSSFLSHQLLALRLPSRLQSRSHELCPIWWGRVGLREGGARAEWV